MVDSSKTRTPSRVTVSTPMNQQLYDSLNSPLPPKQRSKSQISDTSVQKMETGTRGSSFQMDKAIVLLKPTSMLFVGVILSLIGPFQYGWSLSQVNLASYHDEKDCQADPVADNTCTMFPGHSKMDWTLIVNLWILGGAIGGLFSGRPSDKFGRRYVLMVNCLLMGIGALIQAFASQVSVFAFGRFIAGLTSGISAAVSSTYISEVSPPHLRGGLTSTMHLSIVLGIFAVSCVHFFAASERGWRLVASFPCLLAIVHMIGSYFFMVESPPWLISKGRHEKARQEITRLFGEENIEMALNWMDDATEIPTGNNMTETSTAHHHVSPWHELFSAQYSRQLIIALGISMFQQFSGINAVFYYSSRMFREAGVKDERVGSVIVTFINMFTTTIAIFIINRVRKRVLLLGGIFTMFASAIGMTICFVFNSDLLSIILTSTYVSGFSFSLGPLTWVLIAELFPEHVRGNAMAIGSFVHWICNMSVGISYPYIATSFGDFGFVPFVFCLGCALFFIYFLVPETSGKTFEEIQNEFQSKQVVIQQKTKTSIATRTANNSKELQ
jgi:sugar porter (SP) family MFS transporter